MGHAQNFLATTLLDDTWILARNCVASCSRNCLHSNMTYILTLLEITFQRQATAMEDINEGLLTSGTGIGYKPSENIDLHRVNSSDIHVKTICQRSPESCVFSLVTPVSSHRECRLNGLGLAPNQWQTLGGWVNNC